MRFLKALMTGLTVILITTVFVALGGCTKKHNSFHIKDESSLEVPGPDSLFSYQYFLGGMAISSAVDINATEVWNSGNLGDDIRIAVVDPSSIYLAHTDLRANWDAARSFNFVEPTKGTDTTVDGYSSHGTCVAGVIGARDSNSKGIRGVSSRSLISGRTTTGVDSDILEALSFQNASTDVSNNSYGPPDDVADLNQSYSSDFFKSGILEGLTVGRGGLGTSFVWAGGNGREIHDRSNYDGYASFYGVMSICSIDRQGVVSFFSEPGSNLWVCAPGEDIPTTDYNGLKCSDGSPVPGDFADTNYTNGFIGTSAAAPVVTGVVGLVLHEATLQGKSLGWRDIKMILAETAQKPAGVTFQPTRIGFNDDYGFGIVNAKAAVDKVATWTPVGNSTWTEEPPTDTTLIGATVEIPTTDGVTAAATTPIVVDNTISYPVSPNFNTAITYLEHVSVWVSLTHANPGELEIKLTKTNGSTTVTSILSTQHQCTDAITNPDVPVYVDCTASTGQIYEFGVSNFLGESAEGTWTLQVTDKVTSTSVAGSVSGWRLKFYGH